MLEPEAIGLTRTRIWSGHPLQAQAGQVLMTNDIHRLASEGGSPKKRITKPPRKEMNSPSLPKPESPSAF